MLQERGVLFRFCFVLLYLLAPPASAVTVTVTNGAPQLRLTIGTTGTTIDTVGFTIPAASMGNGVAITGSPAITLIVRARSNTTNARTATLTVNSATQLTNTTTGAKLPFTAISWTASDTGIPSGAFNGTAAQVLMSVQNSRQVTTTHTFSYANTQILEAGNYTGQVIYTLTMP